MATAAANLHGKAMSHVLYQQQEHADFEESLQQANFCPSGADSEVGSMRQVRLHKPVVVCWCIQCDRRCVV